MSKVPQLNRICQVCQTPFEGNYRRKLCDECRLAAKRERNRVWREQNPEKSAEASRKYAHANPERTRQIQRAYRQRLKADPDRYARRLENRRMGDKLLRMRKGQTVRVMSEAAYVARYGHGWQKSEMVDAGPVRDLVRGLAPGASDIELENLTGVPARRFYAMRHESAHVALPVADKICVAFGVPLSMLYPDE